MPVARASAFTLAALAILIAPSAHAATFTVTNTANSGGGSLRAAIAGANGAPGSSIVFRIPTTDAGYGAARGVFTIRLTSALPAITGSGTIIDGTTQTANIGDTNPGLMGTGGNVGVDGIPLPLVARPEIEIVDSRNLSIGLDVQAGNVTIRGLAIYGFGSAGNSNTSANIRVGAGGNGILIERNVIGASASGFTNPGNGGRPTGDNVRVIGASNGRLLGNLIGFSNGKGLELNNGSNGWLVEGNEMRGNGIGSSNLDAIDIENGSGGATIRGNLLVESTAIGLETFRSSGSNRVENNTISDNGKGPGSAETAGVRLHGAGNVVDRNVISGNYGAGILVTSGSTGNTITRNSISGNGAANGQIGIDLLGPADNQNLGSAPFVTPNDPGDGDSGANTLPNFPVLAGAMTSGGTLTVTGFARPGSQIEFFVAAPDPSGFGEGVTWIFTRIEGSGADLDATAGAYASPVNGLNVGADTTNRFRFSVAAPPGVVDGTVLTATATLGGETSEFAGNVTVGLGPNLTLLKSVSGSGPQPPGTDLAYTVVFANTGGSPASTVVITDAIPADTDLQVGSAFGNMGSTGLTMSVSYSSDGGATWTYVPSSGAGSAPPGYDRLATHVRFTFTGSLGASPPAHQGSVGFVARIR